MGSSMAQSRKTFFDGQPCRKEGGGRGHGLVINSKYPTIRYTVGACACCWNVQLRRALDANFGLKSSDVLSSFMHITYSLSSAHASTLYQFPQLDTWSLSIIMHQSIHSRDAHVRRILRDILPEQYRSHPDSTILGDCQCHLTVCPTLVIQLLTYIFSLQLKLAAVPCERPRRDLESRGRPHPPQRRQASSETGGNKQVRLNCQKFVASKLLSISSLLRILEAHLAATRTCLSSKPFSQSINPAKVQTPTQP